MGCIYSAVILITGLESITQAIPFNIPPLFPFALAAIFSMMPTTTVSISMEGKQFPLIQSLPIPAKILFDSKILLNLTLIFPCCILSEILLVLALHPTFPELLGLIFIPAVVILFSVVLGITINLKLHSFDWDKEETIVKQSASAGIGGFAGFFLSVLLGVITFLLPPTYADIAQLFLCFLVLIITALLYRKNNTTQLHTL